MRTLSANIPAHRAPLAQACGGVVGTAEHARHALALAEPGDDLARGGAAEARETLGQAVASLPTASNIIDELSARC